MRQPDLDNIAENLYESLYQLLWRITKDGWPKGNPYGVPEIKEGLKAIAKAKGLTGKDSWYDALEL